MAPVYDFRHVELDKIGRGKRIVKPPGGECSDIFGGSGPSPLSSPNGDLSTPRKNNKSYMLNSNIFTDSTDGPTSPKTPSPSNGKLLATTVRLFGSAETDSTPRKVVDRQRSSIFEEEVHSPDSRPHSLKSTPARRPQINPITGAPIHENGAFHETPRPSNGSINGSRNGTPTNGTNGGTPNGNGYHSNGGSPNGYSNGYSNGHSSPDSPMNGSARFRNPPGGKSSGIF